LNGCCVIFWNCNKQSNPISVWMHTNIELLFDHFFHSTGAGQASCLQVERAGFTTKGLAGGGEQLRSSSGEESSYATRRQRGIGSPRRGAGEGPHGSPAERHRLAVEGGRGGTTQLVVRPAAFFSSRSSASAKRTVRVQWRSQDLKVGYSRPSPTEKEVHTSQGKNYGSFQYQTSKK
jgi:hypothetical protein